MAEFDLKKRYEIFLHTFQKELDKMFEGQKEFIKCKEGCSFCCERGEYPFSKLEFDYLLEGYKKLNNDEKSIILFNIANINEKMSKNYNEQFMYTCPFLINNKCSVYKYRGIICRTFGLLCEHNDGRLTMPFCQELGLNYSQVYDKEKGQLIEEKNGIKLCETEPQAYRIARENVQNLTIAKTLDLVWGESKTMIDYINESDITDL